MEPYTCIGDSLSQRDAAILVPFWTQKEPRGGDGVTIGRYVRDISVKARSILGRPQRGVLSSSRPTESIHADGEPGTREGPMWGVRDVVSSMVASTFASRVVLRGSISFARC